MPFIQSASIPDIDPFEENKYYLYIPNDNSIISIDTIKNFIYTMRQDERHPYIMHKFAREHLGWNTTVRELMEQILDKNPDIKTKK